MKLNHRLPKLGRRLGRDEGAVLPLVALMLVMLVGLVALGVDWGRLHEERRQLQNAADAAALAGVRQLPADPAGATAIARDYLEFNGLSAADAAAASVVIDTTFYPNDTIRVGTARTVNNFFAQVIGSAQSTVGAQAAGIAGSLGNTGDCVLPLAALTDGWDPSNPYDPPPFKFYDPGDPSTVLTIKENPDQSWGGNFGGVELYDPNDFFPALEGNCPGDKKVQTPKDYDTYTGNWGEKFFKSIQTRTSVDPLPWSTHGPDYYGTFDPTLNAWTLNKPSGRFVDVPIVDEDDFEDAKGKKPVMVSALGVFFLTDLGCDTKDGYVSIVDNPDTKCAPGEGVLKGGWVRIVKQGGFAAYNSAGTLVHRLWQ